MKLLSALLRLNFPEKSLFKSMSQAQNKIQPGDYKGFWPEPEVAQFRNAICAQGKETQENVKYFILVLTIGVSVYWPLSSLPAAFCRKIASLGRLSKAYEFF